jgi:hypothetical protein
VTAKNYCNRPARAAGRSGCQERICHVDEEVVGRRCRMQCQSELAADASSRSSSQQSFCYCSAIACGLGYRARVVRQELGEWHALRSQASKALYLVGRRFSHLPSWLGRDRRGTPQGDCVIFRSMCQSLSARGLNPQSKQKETCLLVGRICCYRCLIADDFPAPAVHLVRSVAAHEMASSSESSYQTQLTKYCSRC